MMMGAANLWIWIFLQFTRSDPPPISNLHRLRIAILQHVFALAQPFYSMNTQLCVHVLQAVSVNFTYSS